MLVIKCIEIFLARIVDVSLGTIKTFFLVKGKTIEPFFLAFIEIIVWYAIAISYALGYATGTLIGSKISRLIKGVVGVQIIVNDNTKTLLKNLRNKGYGVSVIELKNDFEGHKKDMLYIQINNNKLKELFNIVKRFDKEAFIVVNETKIVRNGLIK